MKKIVYFLFLIIFLYVLWPYFSIYKFYKSIKKEDVNYVSKNVDWDDLRLGLKDDFKIIINNSYGKKNESFEKQLLSKIFESAIIDILLKDIVTPENIILLINNPDQYKNLLKRILKNPVKRVNYIQITDSNDIDLSKKINYIFFTKINKFRIDFNEDEYRIIVDLKLSSFKWKIHRIYLPINTIISKINN